MRSNGVAWNPQEPMNMVCANEDHNLYTFDLRKLREVRATMLDAKCARNGSRNFGAVLKIKDWRRRERGCLSPRKVDSVNQWRCLMLMLMILEVQSVMDGWMDGWQYCMTQG